MAGTWLQVSSVLEGLNHLFIAFSVAPSRTFPCSPFLFLSVWQYMDRGGGSDRSLPRAQICSAGSARRGSVQAAPAPLPVLPCPVQTKDQTLLCYPFTACSINLMLVLMCAVTRPSLCNLSPSSQPQLCLFITAKVPFAPSNWRRDSGQHMHLQAN